VILGEFVEAGFSLDDIGPLTLEEIFPSKVHHAKGATRTEVAS
jgi:hypothetical protein